MRGTTNNYVGRQVDLEMLDTFDGTTSPTPVYIRVTGGITSRVVSGIEKCVQRFVSLLFTDNGSVRFDSSAGSDMMSKIRTGAVSSKTELQGMFGRAAAYAKSAMRADDMDPTYGQTPDDERLDNVRLEDVELDRGTGEIRLVVKLTTVAGDNFMYIVPVASNI